MTSRKEKEGSHNRSECCLNVNVCRTRGTVVTLPGLQFVFLICVTYNFFCCVPGGSMSSTAWVRDLWSCPNQTLSPRVKSMLFFFPEVDIFRYCTFNVLKKNQQFLCELWGKYFFVKFGRFALKTNLGSMCRFVDAYTDLQSSEQLPADALFQASARALLAEGVVLKARTAPPVGLAWSTVFLPSWVEVCGSSSAGSEPVMFKEATALWELWNGFIPVQLYLI